ncbi:hypothetical protein [Streptomyces sp. NPDC051776]|uniref:hypothetical protein n=1 Tax=Streptomyces sp. NPDC051776 TaxID=3155414 RepID=UPI00343A0AE8
MSTTRGLAAPAFAHVEVAASDDRALAENVTLSFDADLTIDEARQKQKQKQKQKRQR